MKSTPSKAPVANLAKSPNPSEPFGEGQFLPGTPARDSPPTEEKTSSNSEERVSPTVPYFIQPGQSSPVPVTSPRKASTSRTPKKSRSRGDEDNGSTPEDSTPEEERIRNDENFDRTHKMVQYFEEEREKEEERKKSEPKPEYLPEEVEEEIVERQESPEYGGEYDQVDVSDSRPLLENEDHGYLHADDTS